MTDYANIAATLMEHLCNHDWHGYDQNRRYGDGEGVCPVSIDGRTYNLNQGDRDCSSAAIDCWQRALEGTPYEGCLDGATYTGNMRQVFVASGLFEWHPMGDGFIAQRGDIYLNERDHTAMCVSAVPDLLAEFSINEFGGIVGGAVGDQTGHESSIHGYYDFPWDGILHFKGLPEGSSKSIRLQLYPYNDSVAQRFWPNQYLDGSFSFENAKFGNVLDCEGGRSENGTSVIGWEKQATVNQRWLVIDRYLDTSFGRHIELAPVLDFTKRLDAKDGIMEQGTTLQLWDVTRGINQTFTIMVHDDGSWSFLTEGGLALDMFEG